MRRVPAILTAIFILAVLLLPASCNNSPPVVTNSNKAAIIDQLYLRQPNPALIDSMKNTLESYGFDVDVWQGNDVTVDLYGRLPSLGYRVIILRVHSGLLVDMEGKPVFDTTFLFTAENYSTSKHVGDQLSDKVSYALMEDNSPYVFAVNSDFIKSAGGRFDRTLVFAMGCESYKWDDLAEVFYAKGASAYIGWSDIVSLDYVDGLLPDLLHNLFSANMTLDRSISQVMQKYGRDPYFDAYLKFYPAAGGNSTIKQLIGK
jgi:hypothetical protein